MILAAGRGERMRPLTDTTPKPLLKAGGKPLIVWHIENLVHAGYEEIVINHAHLGWMIESALGDGARFGARLTYSPEMEALETAGGIANALHLFGHAPFVVVNGDIWCEYDFAWLRSVAGSLEAQERLAHIVLAPNPPHHAAGDFALEGDTVTAANDHKLTFTGIGVYSPEMFFDIPRGNKAALAPLLRAAIAKEQLGGERHAGRWFDIGTPARLAEIDAQLGGKNQ